MFYYLFTNTIDFYSAIEKQRSHVPLVNMLVHKGLAEPKVSLGVSPQAFDDFFKAVCKVKNLVISKNDIELKFEDETPKVPFKGFKLTMNKEVRGYMAYNEKAQVMYFLEIPGIFGSLFSESLFKTSYKLPSVFEQEKNIHVGIGGSETELKENLKIFLKGIASVIRSGEVQEVEPDHEKLNGLVPNEKNWINFGKFSSKVIPIEVKYIPSFSNDGNFVSCSRKVKEAFGVMTNPLGVAGIFEFKDGILSKEDIIKSSDD